MASVGDDRWFSIMRVEAEWASYPGDLTKATEARRSYSGVVCGKHGTQRQAKALVVRHVVR